jgi:transposase, IS5 family
MLRMYCIANWFNLADEACEDALYDVASFRQFCRMDLGAKRIADATTLLKFRRLLETHKPGEKVFTRLGELLLANGLKRSGGTIVDRSSTARTKIIAAPSSTKNAEGKRDEEMVESMLSTT